MSTRPVLSIHHAHPGAPPPRDRASARGESAHRRSRSRGGARASRESAAPGPTPLPRSLVVDYNPSDRAEGAMLYPPRRTSPAAAPARAIREIGVYDQASVPCHHGSPTGLPSATMAHPPGGLSRQLGLSQGRRRARQSQARRPRPARERRARPPRLSASVARRPTGSCSSCTDSMPSRCSIKA